MYCNKPYKLMKKIIFGLIIINLISSCNLLFKPLTLPTKVPDGPPEYQAGWHDGCSSALAAGGYVSGKFHKFGMGNGIYQHDPSYQNAWGSGWFACVTATGGYANFPGVSTAPFD